MQKTSEQSVFDALPGTIPQIIKKSGVSRPTVFIWIRRMRAKSKLHIKSWRRTMGCCSPYYVAGPGIDAPKPERQTSAQYQHQHYVKHRQAVEKEMRAKRKEALENAARLAKVPNTWLSALGGGV